MTLYVGSNSCSSNYDQHTMCFNNVFVSENIFCCAHVSFLKYLMCQLENIYYYVKVCMVPNRKYKANVNVTESANVLFTDLNYGEQR